MLNVIELYKTHKRLYLGIVISVIVIGILTLTIIPQTTTEEDSLIRSGEHIRLSLAGIQDIKFEFNDPLKKPKNVLVYPIYSAPDKLFSQEAIVNIASNIGFTAAATTQVTNEGYIYTENGKALSFNVTGGTLTYSVPLEDYPTTTQPITITDALSRAKDFVTKIGYDNPIYVWSEDNITLYTETGESVTESSFIDEKTRLLIKIPTRVGNAELYVPFEQYLLIHASGDIVGASLWYPFIDLSKSERVEVIDFADATTKVRLGEILRQDGSFTSTTTFSTSNLGYYVNKDFFHGAETGGYITQPMYIFSNENVTVYVDATE